MLLIIDESNRHEHLSLLKEMERQRHKVFVNGLKWDLETDGVRERDEFDKESSWVAGADNKQL